MLRPYKQKRYRGRKIAGAIRNFIGWIIGTAVLLLAGYILYSVLAPAVSETGQAIHTDWTGN